MRGNKITRRESFKMLVPAAVASLMVGLGGLYYATQIEPAWIKVNEVCLPLKRLARAFDGLRLVQISDIHMGGWMNRERLDRAVATALTLKPDVVLLTGDYLVGRGWSAQRAALLDEIAASLRPLADTCPVVAIMGNHDYWSNACAVREMFSKIGAADLSNTVYTLKNGPDQLHLAGIDDYYEHRDRLDKVLKQLPQDGAAILLAHEPDFADTSAATGRFDLQISGHTHGGQVVVPFFGPPKLPWYGKKYPAGLYRVKDMFQYTNRGVGMGRLGVRFNCRPEITVFVLASEQANQG